MVELSTRRRRSCSEAVSGLGLVSAFRRSVCIRTSSTFSDGTVVTALLKAGVIGGEFRGYRELLATPPGHATPITVRDPDVFGRDLSAPRS